MDCQRKNKKSRVILISGVMDVLTDRCPPQHKKHQNLKDAKCEIFDPFSTPINPAWVGDLRTGEIFFF